MRTLPEGVVKGTDLYPLSPSPQIPRLLGTGSLSWREGVVMGTTQVSHTKPQRHEEFSAISVVLLSILIPLCGLVSLCDVEEKKKREIRLFRFRPATVHGRAFATPSIRQRK